MDEHGPSGTLGAIGRDDIEVVEVVPMLDRIRRARPQATPGGRIALGIISVVPWVYNSVVGRATGGRSSLYRKRIHLDGDFYVELVDKPSARRGASPGFGFVAGHEATPTFSWEWFTIGDGRERATKLQEEGELGIRLEKGRSGDWEVGYTEFLTDVSLRMEPKEGAGRKGSEPRWRVRITEGSRATWPSADEAAGRLPPSRQRGPQGG